MDSDFILSAPRVSILVPSYKYDVLLENALGSIFAQTYRDFEVVIADDGSGPKTWKVLHRWKKKYPAQINLLTHPEGAHRGIAATYQLAFSAARGEFLAFLEADDQWETENLEKKVSVLTQYPSVGTVFSGYRPFGWKGAVLYWRLYRFANHLQMPQRRPFCAIDLLLLRNPAASFSNFVTRRSLFANVPCPDRPELYYDWWILAHLSLAGEFYYIPEPLLKWRIHSLSANYGTVTLAKIRDLQCFLLRLYQSLKAFPAAVNTSDKLQKAEKRMRGYRGLLFKQSRFQALPALLKEPLLAFRFFLHILLTRLLIGKRPDDRPTKS